MLPPNESSKCSFLVRLMRSKRAFTSWASSLLGNLAQCALAIAAGHSERACVHWSDFLDTDTTGGKVISH